MCIIKMQMQYEGERPDTVYESDCDGSPCFGLRGYRHSIDRQKHKLLKQALYLSEVSEVISCIFI